MKKLLFFNATWCGPCRAMKPTVDELEAAGLVVERFTIGQDGSATPEVAAYGVRNIPTFIVLNDGVEVARAAGMMPKAKLEELVNT